MKRKKGEREVTRREAGRGGFDIVGSRDVVGRRTCAAQVYEA